MYHASAQQDSKVLKPHKSTHRKDWVYAAPDPAIAYSFISKGGDYIIWKGSCEDGTYTLAERVLEQLTEYTKTKRLSLQAIEPGFS